VLFNQLSGFAPSSSYRGCWSRRAPCARGCSTWSSARSQPRAGLPAGIRLKVNSIVDEALIDALYRASQAGVGVDIVVRGICAVRPGVPGISDNIRVRSILGRFLEHSRIFAFVGGGEPVVYIGSADMMHRNLDRRVEALVRLGDSRHVEQLMRLLETSMDPATASWHLQPDGGGSGTTSTTRAGRCRPAGRADRGPRRSLVVPPRQQRPSQTVTRRVRWVTAHASPLPVRDHGSPGGRRRFGDRSPPGHLRGSEGSCDAVSFESQRAEPGPTGPSRR
jgi:hypothetical protein